jgi:outer membrane protein assembly factor BamA
MEASGGTIVEFKAGIVHDSRNIEADPTKGFYSEAILTTAPKTGSSNRGYTRLSVIHRGYLPVIGEKLTFAYRLGYQGKIGGHIPFYALQNLTTLFFRQITSEGLGGINSVRGVLRNRIVGDGIFWSNFELRYRFCDFKFLGQDWYLVAHPFIDAGRVVSYYDEPVAILTLMPVPEYYDELKDSMHWSAGLGFKAIMNKNFVISVEYGKPFNIQDGKSGMNIGLNYIF